ncbi:MAG: TonB-dependent receptor plug domain-containing protein, partial [Venatoribacter sp.]
MRYFFTLLLSISYTAWLWASDAQLENITIQGQSVSAQNTANYQVFSRQEIESQFTSLADFLSQVNGVQVQQLSGLGNPALISIRGASSQQTKVLVNGIGSANAQYGGYDLNQISLNQIESIEIIQDSYSGSEANNAIGGTINIITRQSHDTQLRLKAGSYQTYTASLVQPLGKRFGLQLEHQQSANNYKYPVPSPAFDSQNLYHKEALHNADFYRYSAQFTGGIDEISGRVQLSKQRKNIEDFQRNHPDNNAYLAQDTGVFELFGNLHLANMQQRWHLGR